MGYLNKHHRDTLTLFAEAFSPLGVIQANKNAFSGGSYSINDAKIISLNYDLYDEENSITLEVTVNIRGKKTTSVETVEISTGDCPFGFGEEDF